MKSFFSSIGTRKVTAKSTAPASWERMDMTLSTKKLTRKLRKSPQPALSHLGATADSDRARRPPLAEPSATGEELNPGDRVEGFGQLRNTDWGTGHGRILES